MAKWKCGGSIGSEPVSFEVNGGDFADYSGGNYRMIFRGGFINAAHVSVTLQSSHTVQRKLNPDAPGYYNVNVLTYSIVPELQSNVFLCMKTDTPGFLISGNVLYQNMPDESTITLDIYTVSGKTSITQYIPAAEYIGVPDIDENGSPVAGSLREYLINRFTSLTDNIVASDVTKLKFITQAHYLQSYIYNTDCWARSIDTTCVSPWNSFDTSLRAGTLVSPRDMIMANHYPLFAGNTIRFIAQDGTVVDREIASASYVAPGDIRVVTLVSDVPAGIKFAKVLPKNYQIYLPMKTVNTYNVSVPVLYFDQEEKILIGSMLSNDGSATLLGDANNTSLRPQLSPFFETPIGGDSGNPILMPVGNDVVLLTVFTSPTAGSSITHFYDGINAAMQNNGSPYRLSDVDLSSFKTF